MDAKLGDIQMGVSNVMEGSTGSDETLAITVNEHQVVRGKPVLQIAGPENDRRSLTFFFDETFCDVGVQDAKLRAAHLTRTPLPLTLGHIYLRKHFVVEKVSIGLRKTDRRGRPVRIEGRIDLIEGRRGGIGGLIGAAVSAVATLNPLLRSGS